MEMPEVISLMVKRCPWEGNTALAKSTITMISSHYPVTAVCLLAFVCHFVVFDASLQQLGVLKIHLAKSYLLLVPGLRIARNFY